MLFGYEDEAYEACSSYVLLKGLRVRKSKTSKSRTDRKVIRRRFICYKEGHKIPDKGQEGQNVLHPRETRCNCPTRIKIALTDV